MSFGVRYTADHQAYINALMESGLLIQNGKGEFVLVAERDGFIPKCAMKTNAGKRCPRNRCGTLKYCLQHYRIKCSNNDNGDDSSGGDDAIEARLIDLKAVDKPNDDAIEARLIALKADKKPTEDSLLARFVALKRENVKVSIAKLN
jgi:hypothetical protein